MGKSRVPTCQVVLKGHTERVNSLAFSPDGKLLASGSADGTVRLWQVSERRIAHTFEGPLGQPSTIYQGRPAGHVTCVAFSPDGKKLAAGGGRWWDDPMVGGVKLWQVDSRRLLKTLKGRYKPVHSLVFVDNKTLVCGGGLNYQYETVAELIFWDTSDAMSYISNKEVTLPIDGVVFNADRQLLVTGGEDLSLWNLPSHKKTVVLAKTHVTGLAISPDGGKLATASMSDHSVKLWDATGRKLMELAQAFAWSIAFSPSGQALVSGAASEDAKDPIKIWDAATGNNTAILREHKHVWALAFHPSGELLATTGEEKGGENTIRLWDFPTARAGGKESAG